MDVARLGVRDLEGMVAAMSIRLAFQIPMKLKYIIHQAMLEFLHIILLSLTAQELLPCAKQVLYRDDILVGMSELNPPRPTPPRTNLACLGANQTILHSLA